MNARISPKNTVTAYLFLAPALLGLFFLTIFPMLGASYFSGLSGGSHATWKHNTKVYAAIIPGTAGLASTPTTWPWTGAEGLPLPRFAWKARGMNSAPRPAECVRQRKITRHVVRRSRAPRP